MSQGSELPSAVAATAAKPSPKSSRSLWAGVALAVVLLTASGAARAWQARRFDQVLRDGQVAPFNLNRLPLQIGPWIGVEDKLDPEIAKVTGGTDIVTRTYHHKITGQTIGMIFLFGPSTNIYGHSPEICYPAAGCTLAAGPDAKTITNSKTEASWPFFSAIYVKSQSGVPIRKEVYWTWRYNNQWNPGLTSHKGFERLPGMFKVHIDRPIRSKEELALLDVGNPSEAFLKVLMTEIDRLIAESAAAPKTKPAQTAKR